MRRSIFIALTFIVLAVPSFGQDPKPEQLKKMYQDALTQLNAAQDRKNELAMQNEQLTAKVAELTKQLDAARAEGAELKSRDAEISDRTFFLRSHFAAWRSFTEQFPEIKTRWDAYIGATTLPISEWAGILDPQWPLTVRGLGTVREAGSQSD